MCGICGAISFKNQQPSRESISAMMAVMQRRGPDADGIYSQPGAVLGHRRLKIIDLSERSRQPMQDSRLGLTIVFNGAIYNYEDLRNQLTAKGYHFFSSGDTEVILKSYHAWGEACVKRFNGMFAFAILHHDTGRLFLARDRLGIKPLYYVKNASGLRFASALPALLASGDVDTCIDSQALHYYMTFHSVVPAPHTILKGVRKLPPATTVRVDPDGTWHQNTYWQLSFQPLAHEREYDFHTWKAQVLGALKQSVRRRLTADVPVGVLLSGGLDSSLVVALLAEAGQRDLNTFSIGFEDAGDESGNEFQYSDLIAKRFDTIHHKIEVDSGKALPSMKTCVQSMSEPMVSHDCIGFYLLSETVAQSIKVVQSGQGADEIFAGYHWYPVMQDSVNAPKDYRRVFFDRSHAGFKEAIDPRFVEADYSRRFLEAHFAEPGAPAPIDKALRLDSTVMLVDDPVKRVDNMTMAWGLEARVPFLDHELVELVARVPACHKLNGSGKYILKEVARDFVPADVIDRPKGYFPVPALKYLRGEYLGFVQEILNQPAAKQRGLFNPAFLETVASNPDAHITPLRNSTLWQMALLEYWLQLHTP